MKTLACLHMSFLSWSTVLFNLELLKNPYEEVKNECLLGRWFMPVPNPQKMKKRNTTRKVVWVIW